MNSRIRATTLVAILGSLIAVGDAQAGDYSRRGAYVGVNGVWATNLFEDELKDLVGFEGPDVGLNDSAGINARIGYRALSWLAIEVQYEWVQSLGITLAGVEVGEFRPNTVTANLKWVLPLWRLQPYALTGFGVGIWDVEAAGDELSGTGFAARLGVGADVYITDHLALTVEGAGVLSTQEFKFTTSTLDKLYYFSVSGGLTYRF